MVITVSAERRHGFGVAVVKAKGAWFLKPYSVFFCVGHLIHKMTPHADSIPRPLTAGRPCKPAVPGQP